MMVSRITLIYPAVWFFILLLLICLPVHLLSSGNTVIMINSIVIFYWTLYRPHTLPYWLIFVLGAIYDVVAGVPIGVHSLTNIVMRSVVLSIREKYIKQPFVVIWLQYTLLSFIAVLLEWVIVSFSYEYLFGMATLMIHWFISTLLYPVFHKIFNKLNELMPKEILERKIL